MQKESVDQSIEDMSILEKAEVDKQLDALVRARDCEPVLRWSVCPTSVLRIANKESGGR